jgi:hypothetical protein
MLARQGGKAMTDDEIVRAAGPRLTMADVKRLSYTGSWDGIPFKLFLDFTAACGVDLDDRKNMQRHSKLMRSGRFTYLIRSPEWQTHFKPMFAEYVRINNNTQSGSAAG